MSDDVKIELQDVTDPVVLQEIHLFNAFPGCGSLKLHIPLGGTNAINFVCDLTHFSEKDPLIPTHTDAPIQAQNRKFESMNFIVLLAALFSFPISVMLSS
jgi:hypothetical protein